MIEDPETKKKIDLKKITPLHRILVAKRAEEAIVKERDIYKKLNEETKSACSAKGVEAQRIDQVLNHEEGLRDINVVPIKMHGNGKIF